MTSNLATLHKKIWQSLLNCLKNYIFKCIWYNIFRFCRLFSNHYFNFTFFVTIKYRNFLGTWNDLKLSIQNKVTRRIKLAWVITVFSIIIEILIQKVTLKIIKLIFFYKFDYLNCRQSINHSPLWFQEIFYFERKAKLVCTL